MITEVVPLFLLLQLLLLLVIFISSTSAGAAFMYNLPTTDSSSSVSPHLLVQSPSLDNVYKDFVVTSKPLHLRKYNNKMGGNKGKKTKKDSRIYYIPIPPLPYRYVPGVGYDYQPMKIKPILQESPPTTTTTTQPPPLVVAVAAAPDSNLFRLQHRNDYYYFNGRPMRLKAAHAGRKRHHGGGNGGGAGSGDALSPLNLNSRFYYNKNIIY